MLIGSAGGGGGRQVTHRVLQDGQHLLEFLLGGHEPHTQQLRHDQPPCLLLHAVGGGDALKLGQDLGGRLHLHRVAHHECPRRVPQLPRQLEGRGVHINVHQGDQLGEAQSMPPQQVGRLGVRGELHAQVGRVDRCQVEQHGQDGLLPLGILDEEGLHHLDELHLARHVDGCADVVDAGVGERTQGEHATNLIDELVGFAHLLAQHARPQNVRNALDAGEQQLGHVDVVGLQLGEGLHLLQQVLQQLTQLQALQPLHEVLTRPTGIALQVG